MVIEERIRLSKAHFQAPDRPAPIPVDNNRPAREQAETVRREWKLARKRA
jgi:hypothetical protein